MRPKVERRQAGVVTAEGRCVKLFGVEIPVEGGEPEEDVSAGAGRDNEEEEEEEIMRKSWSMGNLTTCEVAGTKEALVNAGDQGYLSDEGPGQSTRKRKGSSGQDRKRGVPWSEEEHRTFLRGLEKLGKGDWRGIAKNFVTTRTPTQVASHAQKYFLRQTNPNKKKRRSSLFDVVINDNASVSGKAPAPSLNENTNVIPEKNNVQKGVEVEAQFFNSTLAASGSLESHPSSLLATKFNPAAGATDAMKNFVVDVESRNPHPLSINLNVKDPFWAEEKVPNFSVNSVTCYPEFFMISTREYAPLFPLMAGEEAATPGAQFNDLELRIAPPQPHRLTDFSSSSTAGTIRVI